MDGTLGESCTGTAAVGLEPFVRWSGLGFDLGKARPSAQFYQVLFAHGREGAVLLLDSYAASLGKDLPPDSGKIFDAVRRVVRAARGYLIVDWDVNTWKPPTDTTAKFLVSLPAETHGRLKSLAETLGTSMSQIAVAATEEAIARLEEAVPEARGTEAEPGEATR